MGVFGDAVEPCLEYFTQIEGDSDHSVLLIKD